MGVTDIKDEKFITKDKNYLTLVTDEIDVDDYLKYEKLDFIKYMLPGNSFVQFYIRYDDYIQTENAMFSFSASLSSLDLLEKENIVMGRMPKNKDEIVVDIMVLNNIMQNDYGTSSEAGITKLEQYLQRKITVNNVYMPQDNAITMNELTIVGICDKGSPSVYMNNKNFVNLLANSNEGDPFALSIFENGNEENNYLSHKIYDIELAKDRIELTDGRMPENDYEIIVNEINEYDMDLYETINDEINGHELEVVGYYTSKENLDDFYTTNNTIKYKLLQDSQNITIYPEDKLKVIDYFNNKGENIEETYIQDRMKYIDNIKNSILSSLVLAGIILAISLVEIFLMMRSSFLSRVKEVGILRAIGVKKIDIYKMFLGEIIVLTVITGIPRYTYNVKYSKGLTNDTILSRSIYV